MTGRPPADGERALSPALDALCEEFEEQHADGQCPKLESYLARVPDHQQEVALRELLQIELWWRHQRGETPQPDEYLERSSHHAQSVNAAFTDVVKGSTGARDASIEGAAGRRQRPRQPAATTGAADRNLLFGILALQMDFITREALVSAMNAWVLRKEQPLGEILVEQNALPTDLLRMLDQLVERHLQQHGNNAGQSLAAISSVESSLKESLAALGDVEVGQSLNCIAATATFVPATPPPESAPSTPRFRVLRPHARGGLGEVFVAKDEELDREVALKQIQAHRAANVTDRARFVQEAEITGNLEHPGVVPVYGLGQDEQGNPFYAMRFIKGDSLRDAIGQFHESSEQLSIAERNLQLRHLLGRFVDVCEAMQYAHDRGVLHRDLKPDNVMLGKYGETLVVDWGLAKPLGKRPESAEAGGEATLKPASSRDSGQTVAGSRFGTPHYMSPEQAAGRIDALGPATDVYSLAATLYHLLAGAPPFDPEPDVSRILDRCQQGNFPRPRERANWIPRPLEAVCLKGMALLPEDRYASPRELAAEIERWLADEPVTAAPENITDRLSRFGRKHKGYVRMGMVSLAVVTAIALVSVILIDGARRRAIDLAGKNQQLAESERIAKDLADQNLRSAMSAQSAAEQRLAVERVLRLCAVAENRSASSPTVGLLLAVEALRRSEEIAPTTSDIAESTVRNVIKSCGGLALHDGGWVKCVAMTPDGTRLVTGNFSGQVRLWDLTTDDPNLAHVELRGHSSEIVCMEITSDGTRLVTGSRDKTARVWDLTSEEPSEPIHVLQGHKNLIQNLAISPDGTRLVTGSWDETARIWDLTADDPSETSVELGWNYGRCRFLTVTQDGRRLVTVSENGETWVWDLEQRDPATSAIQIERVGSYKRLASNGRTLVAFEPGQRPHVRLWDLTSDELISRDIPLETTKRFGVVNVAISMDGRWIATGWHDGTVRLFDLNAENPGPKVRVLTGHMGGPLKLAFTPGGDRLVSISSDGTAQHWDLTAESPAATRVVLRGHADELKCLAVTTSGARLVTGSLDGTVRIWDLTTISSGRNSSIHEQTDSVVLQHASNVQLLDLSGDGSVLSSATRMSGFRKAKVWELSSGVHGVPIEITEEIGSEVRCMALTPRATRLAIGYRRQGARLWDLSAEEPSETKIVLKGHSNGVVCLTISPDGRWLATGGRDGSTRLWDVTVANPNSACIVLEEDPEETTAIGFSPDGDFLVTGGGEGTVAVWDLTTNEPRAAALVPQKHAGRITFLGITSDGTRLVTGSDNGTGFLWELRTHDFESSVVSIGEDALFDNVGIAPYGMRLVTGSCSGALRSWYLGVPNSTVTSFMLSGHSDRIAEIAITPDGARLVTGSHDGTARIWDLGPDWPHTTGVVLEGHEERISSLAITPDGQHLITGSWDETIRIWPLSREQVLQEARRRCGCNLTRDEWTRFFPDEAYRRTFSELPPAE